MTRRITSISVLAVAACATAAAALARPAATPSLSLSAKTVAFGTTVKLQGSVPGVGAGVDVQILTKACGFTAPIPVGSTKTTAGGKYVYALQPMLNSALSAQVGQTASRPIPVHVSPTVQLRRVSANRFGVDVSAGNGAWFTKPALLQRLDPRSKRWKQIASAPLRASSDPGALTSTSSATIKAKVKKGTQLRAFVPQSTVGACYLPAASPALSA